LSAISEKSSTALATRCYIEGLPGKNGVILHNELCKVLFDTNTGAFLYDEKISRTKDKDGKELPKDQQSLVREIKTTTGNIFVKIKSDNIKGLIAREMAVQVLHQLLGGKSAIVLEWPVKLTMVPTGKPQVYWAWLSQGIAGDILEDVMKNEKLKAQYTKLLDCESFSQLVILALLTYPEDGNPSNFKLLKQTDGTYRLMGIDLAHVFVNLKHAESSLFSGSKDYIDVKTMIYFLEAMNQTLDKKVFEYSQQIDPRSLIISWKEMLDQYNAIFSTILEEDLKTGLSNNIKQVKLIELPEEIFNAVELGLLIIKRGIVNYITQNKKLPKHIDLLEAVYDIPGIQYRFLSGKVSPEDYYKMYVHAYIKNSLTGRMHSITMLSQLNNRMMNIEQLAQHLKINEL
jgi:hypothetical protein